MANADLSEFYRVQLSDEEFNKLSSFIYKESGIRLPPVKKVMLQCRLQKRLRELNLHTFKEYCDHLFSKEGVDGEIIHMLDVVKIGRAHV